MGAGNASPGSPGGGKMTGFGQNQPGAPGFPRNVAAGGYPSKQAGAGMNAMGNAVQQQPQAGGMQQPPVQQMQQQAQAGMAGMQQLQQLQQQAQARMGGLGGLAGPLRGSGKAPNGPANAAFHQNNAAMHPQLAAQLSALSSGGGWGMR